MLRLSTAKITSWKKVHEISVVILELLTIRLFMTQAYCALNITVVFLACFHAYVYICTYQCTGE